ncbi:MAG: hypothetical protein R3D25_16790 [Geminicoccaceae bacterium]
MVDASVMPDLPSGNINAAVMIRRGRGGAWILRCRCCLIRAPVAPVDPLATKSALLNSRGCPANRREREDYG